MLNLKLNPQQYIILFHLFYLSSIFQAFSALKNRLPITFSLLSCYVFVDIFLTNLPVTQFTTILPDGYFILYRTGNLCRIDILLLCVQIRPSSLRGPDNYKLGNTIFILCLSLFYTLRFSQPFSKDWFIMLLNLIYIFKLSLL